MPEENNKETSKVTKKNAVLAVIGAVIVGTVGSGLWEMLAKPGLSRLGGAFLSLVTMGSESARNQAYAEAALDPTSIPSLILLLHFYTLPFYLAVAFITIYVLDYRRKIRPKAQVTKGYKLSNVISWVLLIGLASWGFVKFLTINQSVLIFRTFNTNVKICAPYISELSEKQLKAKFASIKTRNDYIALDQEIKKIAESNKITLVNNPLW